MAIANLIKGKYTCPKCRKEDSKDNKEITRIDVVGSIHQKWICSKCGEIDEAVVEINIIVISVKRK